MRQCPWGPAASARLIQVHVKHFKQPEIKMFSKFRDSMFLRDSNCSRVVHFSSNAFVKMSATW